MSLGLVFLESLVFFLIWAAVGSVVGISSIMLGTVALTNLGIHRYDPTNGAMGFMGILTIPTCTVISGITSIICMVNNWNVHLICAIINAVMFVFLFFWSYWS